jgi:Response regulator containing a CheY-like receiver domain and an HTH DNA-binding domain
MTPKSLKIVIAENSMIVRQGLEMMLKRLTGFRLSIIEISAAELLSESIRMNKPDILIANPTMISGFHLNRIKEECKASEMKSIALLYNYVDSVTLRYFDEQISIYDNVDELKQKFDNVLGEKESIVNENDEQQILSVREKEIVVCVVKGMTNREIASSLFLSTHTVITHRRNIARKLQIHSPSGLTIYAIVNKLVELSDIQGDE